jgi:thioredoxin 2
MKAVRLCQECGAINRLPSQRLEEVSRCGKCKAELRPQDVVEVSTAQLSQFIKHSELPLVIDFWAPWCGPCKSFAPVYAQVAPSWRGRATFLKANTEAHPSLNAQFGISGIPTLVVLHNGREKARQSGAMPPGPLRAWLEKVLA